MFYKDFRHCKEPSRPFSQIHFRAIEETILNLSSPLFRVIKLLPERPGTEDESHARTGSFFYIIRSLLFSSLKNSEREIAELSEI